MDKKKTVFEESVLIAELYERYKTLGGIASFIQFLLAYVEGDKF